MKQLPFFFMLCISCAAFSQEKVKYISGVTYTITGTIKHELFYGEPNFGEDTANDRKEWSYILHLDKRGCLMDSGYNDVPSFKTVHLIDIDGTLHLKQFVNKKVVVKMSLTPAETGHHHAPVINDNLYEVVPAK